MHEGESLVLALLSQPDDSKLRLIYADWLEEQGDPVNLARAQLVRLQETWERSERWLTRRRGLERQAWTVFREHPGLLGALKRVAPVKMPILATGVGLIAFLAAGQLADESVFPAGSMWQGALRQMIYDHPTDLTVLSRVGSTMEAEMEQDFTALMGIPARGQFWLEGVVVGPWVVFVSARLAGHVITPGLYIAQLTDDVLEGTWNVPGPKQTGTFRLTRSRE